MSQVSFLEKKLSCEHVSSCFFHEIQKNEHPVGLFCPILQIFMKKLCIISFDRLLIRREKVKSRSRYSVMRRICNALFFYEK